jgi:hypothetical protein
MAHTLAAHTTTSQQSVNEQPVMSMKLFFPATHYLELQAVPCIQRRRKHINNAL